MVDAIAADELEEGRPAVVKVKGREIVIVRWRGQIHALRNICPHQTQPLTGAIVRADVSGTAGNPVELRLDEGDPVIVCPVHTWEFKLNTGHCVVDSSLRVKRYDTLVQDGRVLVDVST